MSSYRVILMAAGVLGASGMALAAYHAHGLDRTLGSMGMESGKLADRMDQFGVGVRHQMLHAVVLVAVALVARDRPNRWLSAACMAFVGGILLFSGMLYWLVLADTPALGAVVPFGALLLIAGWVLLAIGGWREGASNANRDGHAG